MGLVALLAGADAVTALRLGMSMTALQGSIGALNDTIDAPSDAGRKPGKPIPAGLVSLRVGRVVVIAGAGIGLGLAAPSDWPMLILALVVLAIGYAYDVAFKGTAWSWLPFAVGIPLLPVFGWLGTAERLPVAFVFLMPIAVLGGAALAIANARADIERDAAAGMQSVAIRLGPRRSWLVHTGLLIVVVVAAIGTLPVAGEGASEALAAALGASVLVGVGVVIGRAGDGARRERAWELEAVGIAVLAVAWLAGVRPGG